MKWRKWLEDWEMTSLKINLEFLEMDFAPNTSDQDAAWEMYIELLTRVTTQHLEPAHGDENTALESVYSLFDLTRSIIRTHSRDCMEFTKIAVVVLNQRARPFTAKWHPRLIAGDLGESDRSLFRTELRELQTDLRNYTRLLAELAGVEDLTDLEDV